MSGKPLSKESAKQNSNGDKDVQNEELARKLRVSMLTTLTISAYVLLMVLSTTHMMLLREGEIALPIFQVGVSVVEFYRIAPLLILFLHFNLLAKLVLYAREIYDSNGSKKTPSDSDGSKKTLPEAHGWFCRSLIVLSSLDLKRIILEMKNENCAAFSIRISFLIIFGTIPLLVLLILQARFLAYQDEWFTGFHQIMVTFDLGFQFVFMRNFYNLLTIERRLPLRPLLIIPLINVKRILSVLGVSLVGLVFIVTPLLFVWLLALVPDSSIEKMIIVI